MRLQVLMAGVIGLALGFVIGVEAEDVGQASADVPHARATLEPTPAWSERAKTVPVPVPDPVVVVRVTPVAEPVIQPREPPPDEPATTPAERRVMQQHDVCYPGYKKQFKYRGVWRWRCQYN
jgi:hypothetical protein